MAQLMYELCFCLWSVSLCDETKQDFMSCGAIPILAQQVNAAQPVVELFAPLVRVDARILLFCR